MNILWTQQKNGYACCYVHKITAVRKDVFNLLSLSACVSVTGHPFQLVVKD